MKLNEIGPVVSKKKTFVDEGRQIDDRGYHPVSSPEPWFRGAKYTSASLNIFQISLTSPGCWQP